MKVLPGDLVSATAGAILRRGAPVRHADPEMDEFVGSALCVTDPGLDHLGRDSVQILDNNAEFRDYATSMVGLDLDDPAGMAIARKWLCRHHGGDPSEGVAWHRSGRHYYEMHAMWPMEGGYGTSFRECHFLPYADVHAFDPRLSRVTNIAAPYLAVPDGISVTVVRDAAEALALACLAAGGRL